MNRLVSAGIPHLILSSHSFDFFGFFWYPDGPAPSLEKESDSAMSLDLLRVGGTLAVVGVEGLLVSLIVEDTGVTTGGAEVET